MLWFAAALIAFTSNLDNLTVGLAFGMRSARISTVPNLVIASITMLGTGLAITLGNMIAHAIPVSTINLLGGLVVIGIGASTVLSALRIVRPAAPVTRAPVANGSRRAARALLDKNGERRGAISTREAVILGVALSCNNVTIGVGAGASGISPVITTILAGVFSLVCVGGGSRLGSTGGTRLLGRFAPLLAGIMLVGVGIALATG